MGITSTLLYLKMICWRLIHFQLYLIETNAANFLKNYSNSFGIVYIKFIYLYIASGIFITLMNFLWTCFFTKLIICNINILILHFFFEFWLTLTMHIQADDKYDGKCKAYFAARYNTVGNIKILHSFRLLPLPLLTPRWV